MPITFQVNTHGWVAAADKIRGMHRRYDKVVQLRLAELGRDTVLHLRATAAVGGYGINQRGKPALIKTGVYLESWQARARKRQLEIGPTGDNAHMTNAALSEVLEYGSPAAGVPAYPHVRSLELWAAQRFVRVTMPALVKDVTR